MNIFLWLNMLFRLLVPSEAEHTRYECPDPSYLDGISGGSQQRAYTVPIDRCTPNSRGTRVYSHDKK